MTKHINLRPFHLIAFRRSARYMHCRRFTSFVAMATFKLTNQNKDNT